LKVALNDSARALSAELPTALIDCRTPAWAQAAAKAFDVYLGSVVGVEQCPVEAAAGPLGGVEGVDDQVGAHVVRDRPAGQLTRMQVHDGGQVEEPVLTHRQVHDVAGVALIHLPGGEVPADQIRCFHCGRVRDRGLHPAAQPQPLHRRRAPQPLPGNPCPPWCADERGRDG
jgi:hypothetical protein